MAGPKGDSEFRFPAVGSPMSPEAEPRGTYYGLKLTLLDFVNKEQKNISLLENCKVFIVTSLLPFVFTTFNW